MYAPPAVMHFTGQMRDALLLMASWGNGRTESVCHV